MWDIAALPDERALLHGFRSGVPLRTLKSVPRIRQSVLDGCEHTFRSGGENGLAIALKTVRIEGAVPSCGCGVLDRVESFRSQGQATMTTDTFRKRGAALEDEYFRRVDEHLAERLREQWQHEKDVESLKRESRIDDEAIIEELLYVGIQPGMIKAMSLVPALHVAWANGFVENKEREAVMHAAHTVGITKESTTGHLLTSWLEHQPSAELFQAWEDYVAALHNVLDIVSYRHLHQHAVDTARMTAEAAGGFLGIHSVSVAEERAIRQIDEAFRR